MATALRLSFALFFALGCVSGCAVDLTQRSVDPHELGTLYLEYNGFSGADSGALVNTAKVGYFGGLNSNAEKIAHGRFHIFKPSDDTNWVFFPYSRFKAAYSQLFVTASYQGKSRPVYYAWSLGLVGNRPTTPASEWRQAVDVADDRFIDFWVKEYVLPIAWSNLQNASHRWVGVDEGAFMWDLFGVLDDNNQFVAGVPWNAPFAQNETEFLARIKTFFSKMKSKYPAVPVMVNLGSLADPSTFPAVFADVPGVMVENLYEQGASDYERKGMYWQIKNLAWFGAQAMPADPTRSRVAMIRAYGSQADASAIRSALMLYMLVRGANFFFGPAIDGTSLSFNPSLWQPMRQALGDPIAPFESQLQTGKPEGYRLYWRRTQKGIVYVNWTGESKIVILPADEQFADPDGRPVIQITLADMTGSYVTFRNAAPEIVSAATGNPMRLVAGDVTTLSVSAADADGDPLTFSWNFGDLTTGSGASTDHLYQAAGTYTATATISDGEGGSATSSVTIIVDPAVSLDLSAQPVKVWPGASFSIEWTGAAKATTTDWIGLYRCADPHGAYIAWKYTNAAANGRVAFAAPPSDGDYEFRYFFNNGYALLGTSNKVSVSAVTLSAAPSNTLPSTALSASWYGATWATATDWIGLYRRGEPDGAFISWQYTAAKSSGSLSFLAPPIDGEYELRYFFNNGYTRLATSDGIVVASAGNVAPANSIAPVLSSDQYDIIDLGSVGTGKRFSLRLPVPEKFRQGKALCSFPAEMLPEGTKLKRGWIRGVLNSPGTYTFAIAVEGRSRTIPLDKTSVSTATVIQQYRLRSTENTGDLRR